MAKQANKYASLNAGDLARITRERGLPKPDVLNISDWADWLQGLDTEAQATEPVIDVAAPDYDAMTRAEAVRRAEAAGMPHNVKTTKAEAIDFLMAASGVTEDEQAALDTGVEG